VLLPALLQLPAQNPEAGQIMTQSREMSITSSMSGSLNLIITEKNGAVRNRTISMTSKSYPGEIEKRLIRFIEPADVRGTSMLIIDNRDVTDEMWIYLPALKKTRRIVTSEKGKSFMSSEFSNADMSSPAVNDFTHRHLADSGNDKQWIIESIPADDERADEYGYSRKISYIARETYQVTKMEFYNFDNKLFKTIDIKSTFPLKEGKYMVKDMVATNLINGRRSEIIFSNIREGTVVDDSDFSLRNLEK
jgi:outer membrane lipoprotein-sorting protein